MLLNKFVLLLAVPGLRCRAGFSLVVESWGCSLAVVSRLLLPEAFLAGEDRARRGLSSWGSGLQGRGSVFVLHGLSCSSARGIFPDQGSNPSLLHWHPDSSPLSHQGSPRI